MDRSGITNILMKVSVNYPQFRRHIDDGHGGISRFAIEEWDRRLGFLDYNEALNRLDNHMDGPNGDKIPKPTDLLKAKGARKDDIYHAPISHKYHIEFKEWDTERKHGWVYDQNDYLYMHDAEYDLADGYHYDSMGRICTIEGRVAFQ